MYDLTNYSLQYCVPDKFSDKNVNNFKYDYVVVNIKSKKEFEEQAIGLTDLF